MEVSATIETLPSVGYIAASNNSESNHDIHNMYTPKNTLELVQILGGMDKILKDYVSHSNDLLLTNHQLHQIHDALNTHSSLSRITNSPNTQDAEKGDIFGDICYEFNENQTYLHSIFGEQIATQILHVLHTKIARTIMSSTVIGYMVLQFIPNTLILPIYVIVLSCILWIPFFIIYYLSGNIKALKMILNSFEFWFKILYAVFYAIMTIIYEYHYGVTHGWHYPTLHLIAAIFQLITVPMLVLNISAFDAHNLSLNKKIFFSSVAAILFTFNVINYSLLVSDSNDFIVYITPNNSISVASIISGAARILAIFMWRQTVLIIIRAKKQKCVLIKYIPTVKWNVKTAVSDEEKHVEVVKCSAGTVDVDVNDVFEYRDSVCVECDQVDVIKTHRRKYSESESVTDLGCGKCSNPVFPVLEVRLSTRL
eukprot:108303_1